MKEINASPMPYKKMHAGDNGSQLTGALMTLIKLLVAVGLVAAVHYELPEVYEELRLKVRESLARFAFDYHIFCCCRNRCASSMARSTVHVNLCKSCVISTRSSGQR